MKQNVLDASGKAKFAQGLPPYGIGSINMIATGFETVKLIQGLKNTRDITILTKLGNLLFLGMNAPKLISTFSSATKTINNFTSKNNIKKPDAFKKALSDIDDIDDIDDESNTSVNDTIKDTEPNMQETDLQGVAESLDETQRKLEEEMQKKEAEAKKKASRG